uniref:Major facilitator superfamily (MFS) profile domain-containing protein n=1 Tax=Plectus sambesii TaxID=2011161 RepID=A0A914W6A1_9BILA
RFVVRQQRHQNFSMGLSWQLVIMSLAAGIAGNFQLGYLAAVLSQPYVIIESYLNSSLTERSGYSIDKGTVSLLMSALIIVNPVAQMIGQMVALYICDRMGRRRTALFGCLLIFPGCLLSFGAKYLHPAFELLFIGRLIWSLANGILIVNQTIWLVEAAPARYRGSVSSMQEVFASLGSLITQAFGVPFSTNELWPMMFIFPMVINVFCIAAFSLVHESPHYLLFKRNVPEEARRAIAAYHGISDKDKIEAQFEIVKNNGKSSADQGEKPKVNGMDIMFRPWKANDNVSKVIRHGAWVGLMVKIAFVFTATRVFRSFGTYILSDMGGWDYLEARYVSLAISILRVPATLVPVFFIDRIGRRPLLIWSTAASILSLLIIMISIFFGASWKIGTLTGALLLQTVNVIGLGSLSRFYGAELVPRKLLLKSVSTLAIIEALVRVVPEFTFYPLSHSIGAYYFIVFIVPTLFFLVLIWYYCPETKGKSINEVLNEMARRKGIDVSFHVGETPKSKPVENLNVISQIVEFSVNEEKKRAAEAGECEVDIEMQPNFVSASDTQKFDLPIELALKQWEQDIAANNKKLILYRCLSSPN